MGRAKPKCKYIVAKTDKNSNSYTVGIFKEAEKAKEFADKLSHDPNYDCYDIDIKKIEIEVKDGKLVC